MVIPALARRKTCEIGSPVARACAEGLIVYTVGYDDGPGLRPARRAGDGGTHAAGESEPSENS